MPAASAENINKTQTKKRVLVAPLDWGLGHATRCIPVIRGLLEEGFDVLLGAEGACSKLLAAEFPHLKILPLKGYGVHYSRKRHFFFIKMLMQSGKIMRAVKKEHRWLKKVVAENDIDLVISDNRFGLYNKNVHCIFMTHQLFIKTGSAFTEKKAQKINYRFIRRFNECWVPDLPGNDNLAGALSHPEKMPEIPVRYLGSLSRFTKRKKEKSFDILAMISGPEPQRTLFETVLTAQLENLPGNNVLLRGLPGNGSPHDLTAKNFRVFDHLPGNELADLMQSAEVIIAASGYSTVMDLAALQRPAILIPTPGQAEQEYLAKYLSGKKYCISCDRETLDLREELGKFRSAKFTGFPKADDVLLKDALRSLQ